MVVLVMKPWKLLKINFIFLKKRPKKMLMYNSEVYIDSFPSPKLFRPFKLNQIS